MDFKAISDKIQNRHDECNRVKKEISEFQRLLLKRISDDAKEQKISFDQPPAFDEYQVNDSNQIQMNLILKINQSGIVIPFVVALDYLNLKEYLGKLMELLQKAVLMGFNDSLFNQNLIRTQVITLKKPNPQRTVNHHPQEISVR